MRFLDTERRTPSKMKSGKVLSIYGFSSIFWNLLLRSIYSLCYRCRANLKSSGDETESMILIQRHLTPIRPNLKYPINLRPKRNRDFMYRATQISSLLYFLTWPMCILSFRHTLKYFCSTCEYFPYNVQCRFFCIFPYTKNIIF